MMHRLFSVLLVVWSATVGACAGETLTVSAAASLKDALTEIKPLFTEERGTSIVTYNFAGSGALQQQIEAGAPVDVFISAAPKQMDALEKKGLLLAETRRELLTNTLVLIAPKEDARLGGWSDLAGVAVKHIAIGDPKSVPAGTYAAEVFAHLKLREALEPKLVRMLDVRQVLTTVETRNAEAGVVYLTDARLSAAVRIVATAPPGSHAPVVYPVAVIKDSKNAAAAREFVAFLAGAKARAIFERFGFGAAP